MTVSSTPLLPLCGTATALPVRSSARTSTPVAQLSSAAGTNVPDLAAAGSKARRHPGAGLAPQIFIDRKIAANADMVAAPDRCYPVPTNAVGALSYPTDYHPFEPPRSGSAPTPAPAPVPAPASAPAPAPAPAPALQAGLSTSYPPHPSPTNAIQAMTEQYSGCSVFQPAASRAARVIQYPQETAPGHFIPLLIPIPESESKPEVESGHGSNAVPGCAPDTPETHKPHHLDPILEETEPESSAEDSSSVCSEDGDTPEDSPSEYSEHRETPEDSSGGWMDATPPSPPDWLDSSPPDSPEPDIHEPHQLDPIPEETEPESGAEDSPPNLCRPGL